MLVSGNTFALRLEFDETMFRIYTRVRDECGYNATGFLKMLHEHKGVETVRRLLPSMSDNYAELWRCGRLDLTVEALILREPWRALFSDAEHQIARRRLADSGYKFSNGEV